MYFQILPRNANQQAPQHSTDTSPTSSGFFNSNHHCSTFPSIVWLKLTSSQKSLNLDPRDCSPINTSSLRKTFYHLTASQETPTINQMQRIKESKAAKIKREEIGETDRGDGRLGEREGRWRPGGFWRVHLEIVDVLPRKILKRVLQDRVGFRFRFPSLEAPSPMIGSGASSQAKPTVNQRQG